MTILSEAQHKIIKKQEEFILELKATIKRQDDMLDKSIATSDDAIRVGEIACKALVWIVEHPMAPARSVALDALVRVKGELS